MHTNAWSALCFRSVLENHHCAVAFETIERAGILAQLDESEYKMIRKLVVSGILATDSACACCTDLWPHAQPPVLTPHLCVAVSVHKDLLARVMLRATRDTVRGAGAGGFSRASFDDRSILICFLLHCADLCAAACAPAPPVVLLHSDAGSRTVHASKGATRCCRRRCRAALPTSWQRSSPTRRS